MAQINAIGQADGVTAAAELAAAVAKLRLSWPGPNDGDTADMPGYLVDDVWDKLDAFQAHDAGCVNGWVDCGNGMKQRCVACGGTALPVNRPGDDGA